MKDLAQYWNLKLNKKVKTWEILHQLWAIIPGMNR